jgi:hypothetical protein
MNEDHLQFNSEDREMLKQIHDAIFGVKIGPKKQAGLLDLHVELFHEIHGRNETQSIGLKQRLADVEGKAQSLADGKAKVIAGAMAVSAILGVIGWTLMFIFK